MKKSELLVVSLWFLMASHSVFADDRPQEGTVFTLNNQRFTVPKGFLVEQVAGPPLVDRPISADFDEQGRLYVSESSGSNENIQIQLEKKPHRILRLEDTNQDGRFDTRTVFADRMMFPEGTLWHEGSLYVAAPPSIWKLTDLDQDGVADIREEWFKGKTLTGCANDLHGPYLGPDGWIYWCKGAFAEQTYERPGQKPWTTRASHIFRRKPEGGPIEHVMTGGMDNPVEVVFTPGGERIFSTTFLQNPSGGYRDGLIHAIYGGVYGKVHNVIEGHPRTGPIMPVLSHLGAAAPCGLARLVSDRMGKKYQNNVFTCLFNMHKITRHQLTVQGSSFASDTTDFLTSDSIDFHPTDVLEDADGSLLVVDTGGWYKLCCPTSQLWKPDVLGSIYRIRPERTPSPRDPRGIRIPWQSIDTGQLTDLLSDSRPAVRKKAQSYLVKRGTSSIASLVSMLKNSPSETGRLEAVWTLHRFEHNSIARSSIHSALKDTSQDVRQSALHSISIRRDSTAMPALIALLDHKSLHNRRAAAQALGRLGDPNAISHLLEASATYHDRIMEHALIFAMIEIQDAREIRKGLLSDSPHTQRVSLIALDQLESPDLKADDIASLLASDDPVLSETSWWIATRHPEWAESMIPYFQTQFMTPDQPEETLQLLSKRITPFSKSRSVQDFMAGMIRHPQLPPQTAFFILDAMAASTLPALPESWSGALRQLLEDADVSLLHRIIATVHRLSNDQTPNPLRPELLALSHHPDLDPHARLQTLVSAQSQNDPLGQSEFEFISRQLSTDQPVANRSLAVDILVSVKLNLEQLFDLSVSLEKTGPMELKRLMTLFQKRKEPELGSTLVRSLTRSAAATSLHTDQLKTQLASFGTEVVVEAEPLIAKIEQQTAEKITVIEKVIQLSEKGDARRGQQVFHSTKTACASCHAVGYLGGDIGPDLTRIGRIRTNRDILEAILFPNVSFVRSFEPTVIITNDGQVHNGVVKNETNQEIVLALDAQKIIRIPQNKIEQRYPSTVSIMPEGLEKQLSLQDVADLLTFLRTANN